MVKTKDIALASFLMAKGKRITELNGNSKFKEFVFGDATLEDKMAFLNNSTDNINARRLSDAMRTIKAMAKD